MMDCKIKLQIMNTYLNSKYIFISRNIIEHVIHYIEVIYNYKIPKYICFITDGIHR